eukprot:Tbor_TRINITY_DN3551_c0_g1::TRINITY_DN3551_c0_g1_i1::g.2884::m.2884/K10268/FBXL2_20; F-box and leucine-rich repeat protein 2/20
MSLTDWKALKQRLERTTIALTSSTSDITTKSKFHILPRELLNICLSFCDDRFIFDTASYVSKRWKAAIKSANLLETFDLGKLMEMPDFPVISPFFAFPNHLTLRDIKQRYWLRTLGSIESRYSNVKIIVLYSLSDDAVRTLPSTLRAINAACKCTETLEISNCSGLSDKCLEALVVRPFVNLKAVIFNHSSGFTESGLAEFLSSYSELIELSLCFATVDRSAYSDEPYPSESSPLFWRSNAEGSDWPILCLSLKTLLITGCSFISTETDGCSTLGLRKEWASLTKLDIARSTVDDSGLIEIGNKCTSLEMVVISHCRMISDFGVSDFIDVAGSRLTMLNLSHTSLGECFRKIAVRCSNLVKLIATKSSISALEIAEILLKCLFLKFACFGQCLLAKKTIHRERGLMSLLLRKQDILSPQTISYFTPDLSSSVKRSKINLGS